MFDTSIYVKSQLLHSCRTGIPPNGGTKNIVLRIELLQTDTPPARSFELLSQFLTLYLASH